MSYKWEGTGEGGELSDCDAGLSFVKQKGKEAIGKYNHIITDSSAFLRKFQPGWWRALSQKWHTREDLRLTGMACIRTLGMLSCCPPHGNGDREGSHTGVDPEVLSQPHPHSGRSVHAPHGCPT